MRCGEGHWSHERRASRLKCAARPVRPNSESRETALNVPQIRSICAQAPRVPCTRKSHPEHRFRDSSIFRRVTLLQPLVDSFGINDEKFTPGR